MADRLGTANRIAAQPQARGLPVPNQAYLRLRFNGSIDVFNSNGSIEVIVDVFGT